MITYYTREDLKSGDDFVLRDNLKNSILSFENLQRLGGRKYRVCDSDDNFLYIIADTDIETKNEYTLYDNKSRILAVIKRFRNFMGSKIIVEHESINYKFDFSVLPKLKMTLSHNEEVVISALIKNVNLGYGKQSVLETLVMESDDVLLNLAVFSTIGIIYSDSY